MSASKNLVILIGRLGADLKLEDVKSGQNTIKIAKGSIATSESYKDKSGNWQEITDWVNIRFYDKLAEKAAEKLKKGDNVFIEGKIKTWKYEQGGKTQYATAIKAERFINLQGKKSEPVPAEAGDFGEQSDMESPF